MPRRILLFKNNVQIDDPENDAFVSGRKSGILSNFEYHSKKVI